VLANETPPVFGREQEKFKAKRDRDRKQVSKSFNAYIAAEKKEIENHYASKAEERQVYSPIHTVSQLWPPFYLVYKRNMRDHRKLTRSCHRSAEAKDLLARYAEALEQRAAIEKSIEEVVSNAREDLKELTIVLEAAYSGRHEQVRAAVGSFASIAPVRTKGAITANPSIALDEGVERQKRPLAGDPAYATDVAGQYEKEYGENFMDHISW
jgi:hypothetical protein